MSELADTVCFVLRRFLYLDDVALGQYVSALEGGSLTGATHKEKQTGGLTGEVGLRVAKASGSKAREAEQEQTFADTDEARFDRLLAAAKGDPEALGWIDVTDPDSDFDGLGLGAMISWECDIYIPDVIKMMSGSGEMRQALDMMQNLLPSAEALGLDIAGVPSTGQLQAMSGLIDGMNASLVIVGEDDDTQWSVSGRLAGDVRLGQLEGRAIVVGKVSKVLRDGSWEPFLTFPGMNLGSREQRRALKKQAPEPDSSDQHLHGPALLLDVLAIYR